jgi:hypothetical protein
MKKQFRTVAAAMILAVNASAAFAVGGDFGIADIENVTSDVTTFETLAITEMSVGYGLSSATQNVAFVAQTGDSNIAYINQTGSGNFAVAIQNSLSGNAAYMIQTGDTNRAVVIQH